MAERTPLLKFFDVQTSFYKPLWIRVAVTGVCLLWALLELSRGALFWAALFGGLGLYLGHQFFIAFDPREDDDSNDETR